MNHILNIKCFAFTRYSIPISSYYRSPWDLVLLLPTDRSLFPQEKQVNEVCLVYCWAHLHVISSAWMYVKCNSRSFHVAHMGDITTHCNSSSIYCPNTSETNRKILFYKLLGDLFMLHHIFWYSKEGDLKSLVLKFRPQCALKSKRTVYQLVGHLLKLFNWSIY